jgi:hypothetical protein
MELLRVPRDIQQVDNGLLGPGEDVITELQHGQRVTGELSGVLHLLHGRLDQPGRTELYRFLQYLRGSRAC